MGGLDSHLNIVSWAHRVQIPTGISIGSAVFGETTVMTDRRTTLLRYKRPKDSSVQNVKNHCDNSLQSWEGQREVVGLQTCHLHRVPG